MKLLFPIALLACVFAGCTKTEDPNECTIPNEGEVITKVTLSFTDAGGTAVVWTFDDPDGDGGNAPEITTAPLAANTAYTLDVTLFDTSVEPAEAIHEEVAGEAEDHQFFMVTESDIDFAYNDTDANGKPIGLAWNVQTADATSSTVTVILRHQPDKTADGVASGDPTNAGGETDVEVTFDAEVE